MGKQPGRGGKGEAGCHWPGGHRCVAGLGRDEGGGTAKGSEAVSEAGNSGGYSRIVGRVELGQWEGPPCWAASQWLCSSAGRDDLRGREREKVDR